jgi:hypothetical protein
MTVRCDETGKYLLTISSYLVSSLVVGKEHLTLDLTLSNDAISPLSNEVLQGLPLNHGCRWSLEFFGRRRACNEQVKYELFDCKNKFQHRSLLTLPN